MVTVNRRCYDPRMMNGRNITTVPQSLLLFPWTQPISAQVVDSVDTGVERRERFRTFDVTVSHADTLRISLQ